MDTFSFQATIKRKCNGRHRRNPFEVMFPELDGLLGGTGWKRGEFDDDGEDYLIVDVQIDDVYVSEDDVMEDGRDPEQIAEDRALRDLAGALDGSAWTIASDLAAVEE